MAAGRDGFWRRVFRRLASSNDDLVSEDLSRQAETAGAQTISGTQIRQRVHLRGAIHSITLSPESENRRLEAELIDGTGSVTIIWMGRRIIPGIEVGRTIDVRGTLTVSDGRRVIFNPAYDISVDA